MIFRSLEALPSVREKLSSSSVLISNRESLVQVRLSRRLNDELRIRGSSVFFKTSSKGQGPCRNRKRSAAEIGGTIDGNRSCSGGHFTGTDADALI